MSAAPLLSSLWYRVADLKPMLRSHAKLHRHRYRGEVWYLLQDPASGRINRFAPAARLVIALMDGTRTVAQLWEAANHRLGEDAPTQDEMIQLLGQLHAADMLRSDVNPDVAELFDRGEKEERARHRRSFGNPMAIRVPLWDPDAFLNNFPGLIALIWSKWGAALWLGVVLPAAFLILPHWPELSHNFSDRLLAIDNLVVLYFVFPLLKAFHELGHATATKARGGEVHDLGIILLVMLPVPYVEASASSTFRSKYQRALVGAAGVAVELFIASLAFYLWLLVEPGVLRAGLFNVMVIASVSTLIFNGNPLLRYDAYYILADLIEIPNLGARSLRYWSYLLERYLLGVKEREPPHATVGEKVWFLFYGAASSIYRVLVTVLIALFIAGRFFFIGVLLAIWAFGAMAIAPIIRTVRHLTSSPNLHRHRARAITVSVGLVCLIGGFLIYVPMPYHTEAEGIVWLQEEALVRAGANGFISEILAQPGTHVSKGDALIRSMDPQLIAKMRAGEARVAEWKANYAIELVKDRTKADMARQRLSQEEADLAVARQRAEELTVRAQTDGTFIVPEALDLPGRYYHQGDLMAYVIGSSQAMARVVVSQDAIDRVRAGTDRVRVRMVDHPRTIVTGHIVRAVPGADEYLPSKALAVDGGGDIATDPRDQKGAKAMQRMFQFDVALDLAQPVDHFGQRVYVRFEHDDEPLSVQLYRRVRLLFLSRFSV
jgi:putative peptide zinc metalloprotease protein